MECLNAKHDMNVSIVRNVGGMGKRNAKTELKGPLSSIQLGDAKLSNEIIFDTMKADSSCDNSEGMGTAGVEDGTGDQGREEVQGGVHGQLDCGHQLLDEGVVLPENRHLDKGARLSGQGREDGHGGVHGQLNGDTMAGVTVGCGLCGGFWEI